MTEEPLKTSDLQDAVKNREALLDAVAQSAKSLLSSSDWISKMDDILKQIGEATSSSRVYVFEHNRDQSDNMVTSLVFEWCSHGVSPQLTNPELKNIPIGYVGFQRWIDMMSKGEAVFGKVSSFPDDERPLLERQDIKSLVVIPFFVFGDWWGFIGFDQCDRIREWSKPEVEALQALGSMIGSAIERRAAEKKMQFQFNELKKTNQELDFFVYSVSHDLRAPLASLQGLIHLAQLDNPPEPFKNYFNMMGDSVIRLDGFIKEVLDYSVNSRKDILFEPIDFEQLISETAEQLTLAENETAVLWKVEVSGQHNRFHSDRRRLQIIFNNLLSNALKFRDFKKDQLVIEIQVGINPQGAQIQVADNGIGIAEQYLDKIFNMFYRATEQNPGSGLGLYITREVVHKLAGTIQVQSEIHQYTRFNVWVPNMANR